jgi:hypothetical protein
MLYMVTFTINIPQMLAYIPAPWILWGIVCVCDLFSCLGIKTSPGTRIGWYRFLYILILQRRQESSDALYSHSQKHPNIMSSICRPHSIPTKYPHDIHIHEDFQQISSHWSNPFLCVMVPNFFLDSPAISP